MISGNKRIWDWEAMGILTMDKIPEHERQLEYK